MTTVTTVVPARFQGVTHETQTDTPTPRSVHYYVADLEAKLEAADRHVTEARAALMSERLENESLAREGERLRAELREHSTVVRSHEVNLNALALLSTAELERMRDTCQQAVRDIAEAAKLLSDLSSVRTRDVYEAARSAVGRVYASARSASAGDAETVVETAPQGANADG